MTPLWFDSLILLSNLNKYLQKCISLINCFEIIFILSLFNSCLLQPFSSFVIVLFNKFPIFIVWLNDIVFYEGLRIDLKLELALLKLNFVYSWFFGDVMLAFMAFFPDSRFGMILSLASVRMFFWDLFALKWYFLRSWGSNLLCFSIHRHRLRNYTVLASNLSFLLSIMLSIFSVSTFFSKSFSVLAFHGV